MALMIAKPYIHVEDANGNPYVGAKLYIYLPGTTTLADVYTDAALTVPASNPATSDAAGNFPRLYIAAGTYKLRAQTSASVLIWEEDNIDTGLSAGTGALPITGGGTGATTAAAARTNLDVPSNSQLTELEETISTLQSAVQNIVSAPQGYLTPTTGVPFISSDVTAGTTVYYTPLLGNLVPVYDGAQFNPVSFDELMLTLNSNHTAGNFYDVFFTKDGNDNPLLVTGPAWNTTTAGSGSRGAGAGTTEIDRVGGLYVNKYAMSSARNGATTYAIDANKATYLGSLWIDGTNGQVTCHTGYGQSRKRGIWNAFNRIPIILKIGDATATWTYNSTTIRQSNAAAANTGGIFIGLQEETADIVFDQSIAAGNGGATASAAYIGYNSTTVASGLQGFANYSSTLPTATAKYSCVPVIGLNNVNMLESAPVGTPTFNGTESSSLMTIRYRA